MSKEPKPRKAKRGPREGTSVVWPRGVAARLGVSSITRWRMEKDGRLPPRDYFIGGVAVGWKPETLERAARGPAAEAG